MTTTLAEEILIEILELEEEETVQLFPQQEITLLQTTTHQTQEEITQEDVVLNKVLPLEHLNQEEVSREEVNLQDHTNLQDLHLMILPLDHHLVLPQEVEVTVEVEEQEEEEANLFNQKN